ncbi:SEC-C metal-binding domain-containing protein [Tigheibacillus jepli]
MQEIKRNDPCPCGSGKNTRIATVAPMTMPSVWTH